MNLMLVSPTGFPSACLAKPSRGGKSRNLTTQLINQVQQYEVGVDKSPAFEQPNVAKVHLKLRSNRLQLKQLLNWNMVTLQGQCGYCILTTS